MGEGYVTALGPVDIDEYFILSTPLLPGAKCMVKEDGWQPGGLIANAAAVLGTLGRKTYLLDTLGQDEYTDSLTDSLQNMHVDTGYLEILPDCGNLRTTIYLWEGERTICIHENPKPPVTMDNEKRNLVLGAEFLYTTVYNLKELKEYGELIKDLKNSHTGIMLDVEPVSFTDRQTDRILFEAADILSFNEASYEKYQNQDSRDYAKELAVGGRIVMVTMGEKGCRICTPDREIYIPAVKVKAVDTTGAGDTHNASFLYAYLKGWDIESCGRFAAAAAARCVSGKGALFGAVPEKTVLDFWKERMRDEN